MREHSRDRGRLEDILKYAQNVEQIVSGITYEQFVADIRIYYSVMKNVEVIGVKTPTPKSTTPPTSRPSSPPAA